MSSFHSSGYGMAARCDVAANGRFLITASALYLIPLYLAGGRRRKADRIVLIVLTGKDIRGLCLE